MMPVRLETEDGSFVTDGFILPFITGYPKIVSWGERVFLLFSEPAEVGDEAADEAAARLGAPAIYRETFWTSLLPKAVTASSR